mgnify:CR=1 FL=1
MLALAVLLISGEKRPARNHLFPLVVVAIGVVVGFPLLSALALQYRGLAQGGIASVGQLQLLQPFFGLALAATLRHKHVSPGMLAVTVGVIACVYASKKYAR